MALSRTWGHRPAQVASAPDPFHAIAGHRDGGLQSELLGQQDCFGDHDLQRVVVDDQDPGVGSRRRCHKSPPGEALTCKVMHHFRCTRSFSFQRKCSSMTGRMKRTSSASALPSSDRRRPAHTGLLVRLIRALRDWVRRPVAIYRLDGRWRAGLVERRRAPADAWAFRVLLDDLQERLLTQEPGMADALLGQLIQVHDEGRQKGWAGVLALPPGGAFARLVSGPTPGGAGSPSFAGPTH